MNIKYFLFFITTCLIFSCSDSNVVGLEVQPNSDIIEIFNSDILSEIDSLNQPPYSLSLSTSSEDSLRTDETSSLLLGKISKSYDPYFGDNIGSFVTQIALSENNIDLGNNPIVDSVIFSYSYSGYYGDLSSINAIAVNYVDLNIYKDSVYYSNQQFSNSSSASEDLLLDFIISSEVIILIVLDVFEKGSSILLDDITISLSFTVSFCALIGVDISRETRRSRIEARLTTRINEGLIPEVERLIKEGIDNETLQYYGLEYKCLNHYY